MSPVISIKFHAAFCACHERYFSNVCLVSVSCVSRDFILLACAVLRLFIDVALSFFIRLQLPPITQIV